MSSKLYLLLVILSVFVICSISVEQKGRKDDSALDTKKKALSSKDDNRRKEKYETFDDEDDDESDDYYPSLSSYADNRYTAYNPPEGNYRTRARWSSSYPSSAFPFEDILGGNDWSRFEQPTAFSIPSASLDGNPLLNNGPTCTSLIDPQYPVFSDTCGAVPQARYSLPNRFGHRERWQLAQFLTMIVGASTDPACTRSLRLLMCPVLFPPCLTRHDPPPVLPCQSYCRAVKARCSMPALDLFSCEALPQSSDLCPTNQAYGSFLPSGGFPPVNQPPTGGLPLPNYPAPRSLPSLHSFLSSQGPQPPLTPMSYPPASPSSSMQSAGPLNLYNGSPYATDSLNPASVDFTSRSFANDYRQASAFGPSTRSSTDTRATADARSQTPLRSASAPRSSVHIA